MAISHKSPSHQLSGSGNFLIARNAQGPHLCGPYHFNDLTVRSGSKLAD